jgi:hypothetical protein
MTVPIFLATLGQCPEAITTALGKLLPINRYARIGILHIDSAFSVIAELLCALLHVLKTNYTGCQVIQYGIRISEKKALDGIMDQVTAEAYFHACSTAIIEQSFYPR